MKIIHVLLLSFVFVGGFSQQKKITDKLDTLESLEIKIKHLENYTNFLFQNKNNYYPIRSIRDSLNDYNFFFVNSNVKIDLVNLNTSLQFINDSNFSDVFKKKYGKINNKNEANINSEVQLINFKQYFIEPIHKNIYHLLRQIDNLKFEEKNKILDNKLKAISGIRDTLKTHATLLKKDSIDIANLKTDNQCLNDSIKAINIRLDTTKKYYDSLLNAANKKIESLEEKLNCKIDSLNFKQNLINKENKRSVVYLDNNLSALNQYLLSSDCKIDSLSFQISLQEERIKELENKQPVPSVTDITNLSKRIDILENQLITLNLDNISIKLRLHQLKMREIEIGRIKEKLLSLNSIISYHHTEITRINTNTRALNKTITSMNKKIITIEPVPNPKNYKQNKATFNQ